MEVTRFEIERDSEWGYHLVVIEGFVQIKIKASGLDLKTLANDIEVTVL